MKYKNITLTKRPDNRYQTKIDYNNKTKYIYGNTKQECYNNYLTTIQETDSEEYLLEKWINIWFNTYKATNKVATNEAIKGIIRNYASKFFGYNISEIKPVQLLTQINDVMKDRPRQAQKMFIVYKDIFDKARKNGLIDINPMDAVKRPIYKANEKKALTVTEEHTVLNEIQGTEFETIIKLCLYQGLRIGEALALRYEDIDFEHKKIYVTKSKDAKNRIGTPKTKDSERIIPLFDRTLEVIKRNGSGEIFPLYYDKVQKYLKSLSNKLNIPITSHTFRHTFATRCIESDVNIKQVSKWLGHTGIEITNRIYTHINNDFENEQIKLINCKISTKNIEK